MTQAFTQREPKLVNDPKDISSDKFLSLTDTLSLPLTPSTISQNPTTPFPLKFPTNLDDRYREYSSNNTPLRLDWNTLVAHSPFFGQHLDSHRWHKWALNMLQYRHDIHKDIQKVDVEADQGREVEDPHVLR